jgi:hypothetical protein
VIAAVGQRGRGSERDSPDVYAADRIESTITTFAHIRSCCASWRIDTRAFLRMPWGVAAGFLGGHRSGLLTGKSSPAPAWWLRKVFVRHARITSNKRSCA